MLYSEVIWNFSLFCTHMLFFSLKKDVLYYRFCASAVFAFCIIYAFAEHEVFFSITAVLLVTNFNRVKKLSRRYTYLAGW